MSGNVQKIDFRGPEAEMLKFVEQNGKNCQFQLEDRQIHFSEHFEA